MGYLLRGYFLLCHLPPFPRKGTETNSLFQSTPPLAKSLTTFSPQGDGNNLVNNIFHGLQYRHLPPFPRKGTETSRICQLSTCQTAQCHLPPFPRKGTETHPNRGKVQGQYVADVTYHLFPARGRKRQPLDVVPMRRQHTPSLTTFYPQGDGNQ
jgi:hypothetical protein